MLETYLKIDTSHPLNVSIQIKDIEAGVVFATLTLSKADFLKAIAKESVLCNTETKYLDKVGKKNETSIINLEVSEEQKLKYLNGDKEELNNLALEKTPIDWELSDQMFTFQHDFKNKKIFAKVVIRRWF